MPFEASGSSAALAAARSRDSLKELATDVWVTGGTPFSLSALAGKADNTSEPTSSPLISLLIVIVHLLE
jgi:hypothetical protein